MRSTALITADSQWMFRPVYTDHNQLHSPPSLLPQQVPLSVSFTAFALFSTAWFLFRTFHYAFLKVGHSVLKETAVSK